MASEKLAYDEKMIPLPQPRVRRKVLKSPKSRGLQANDVAQRSIIKSPSFPRVIFPQFVSWAVRRMALMSLLEPCEWKEP
jgi:hypothetical protein